MVKTELNWALRISASSLDESLSSPFSFRGAISIESVFLCLMKAHILLLFEFCRTQYGYYGYHLHVLCSASGLLRLFNKGYI